MPGFTRGCGGVAVLWNTNLPIVPTTFLTSDRFMAVQISLPTSTTLTVIGVYLPSTDHPVAEFQDYLHDLECFISASQQNGPVVIMGDFNAHLCVHGTPNHQGELLSGLLDRCGLYPVPQTSPYGPNYTYRSSIHRSTVDLCLLDFASAHLVSSYNIYYPDPLNFSDHLPISLHLDITPAGSTQSLSIPTRLNWRRGQDDGAVAYYQQATSRFLSNLVNTPAPTCLEQLESEISTVCKFLTNSASNSIPHRQPGRGKNHSYTILHLLPNLNLANKHGEPGKLRADQDRVLCLML